jgi:hypothetical protein
MNREQLEIDVLRLKKELLQQQVEEQKKVVEREERARLTGVHRPQGEWISEYNHGEFGAKWINGDWGIVVHPLDGFGDIYYRKHLVLRTERLVSVPPILKSDGLFSGEKNNAGSHKFHSGKRVNEKTGAIELGWYEWVPNPEYESAILEMTQRLYNKLVILVNSDDIYDKAADCVKKWDM